MNKIKTINIYENYSGFIIERKDTHKFMWVNTNYLGYWNDIDGAEDYTYKVKRVYTPCGLKILELECDQDLLDNQDCNFTRFEALQEICKCWGKDLEA